jgi:hypothetical protein
LREIWGLAWRGLLCHNGAGYRFLRSSVVDRSWTVALAGGALLVSAEAALAGPCTKQIAEVEQQIIQLQATPSPSGAGQPSASQTVGAQLHHQPTPGSVEGAQSKANADATAALGRARKADAAGDAAECAAALVEARRLYGLD